MDQRLYDAVAENPIIAAVSDRDGLQECCGLEEVNVIFLLFGDICNITELVNEVKQAGKIAMVHMDLIGGLGSRDVAVDFIKKHTKADGIISTKAALIIRAKELNLSAIYRIFLLDSRALHNIARLDKQYRDYWPDFIEILPGVMPKIVKKVVKDIRLPLIASGMIIDKEDVVLALGAGATAISTTNRDVWRM